MTKNTKTRRKMKKDDKNICKYWTKQTELNGKINQKKKKNKEKKTEYKREKTRKNNYFLRKANHQA